MMMPTQKDHAPSFMNTLVILPCKVVAKIWTRASPYISIRGLGHVVPAIASLGLYPVLVLAQLLDRIARDGDVYSFLLPFFKKACLIWLTWGGHG